MEFLTKFLVAFACIFALAYTLDKAPAPKWMKNHHPLKLQDRLVQTSAIAFGVVSGPEIAARFSLDGWQRSLVVSLSVGICLAFGQLVALRLNRS
jgi:hypothetical protein